MHAIQEAEAFATEQHEMGAALLRSIPPSRAYFVWCGAFTLAVAVLITLLALIEPPHTPWARSLYLTGSLSLAFGSLTLLLSWGRRRQYVMHLHGLALDVQAHLHSLCTQEEQITSAREQTMQRFGRAYRGVRLSRRWIKRNKPRNTIERYIIERNALEEEREREEEVRERERLHPTRLRKQLQSIESVRMVLVRDLLQYRAALIAAGAHKEAKDLDSTPPQGLCGKAT
ncbi:hypothetical protein ABZ725_27590 [Streptomyces sp. NPDC006872]|uniref:hypothetical protein n=1 Tax=Streptomyces sp. NPDC006872 TaxID=3155720 RepID=UPI0033C89DC0